jgi:hypothetical protein
VIRSYSKDLVTISFFSCDHCILCVMEVCNIYVHKSVRILFFTWNNIHKRIYTVTSLNLYSRVNDILYSLALSLFNYLSNMTGASSWTGTTPLPKHMSSPPVFSGVHVTRSLVLYVMFCRSLFVLFLLPIVLNVLLLFTDSDYPFGIFWPLCCLSTFYLQILITPLVSFGHCVVCPSIYGFWLPLWYLQTLLDSSIEMMKFYWIVKFTFVLFYKE